MKVVELREYRLHEGKKQDWLNWMRDEILPYQRAKGMIILDTYIHQGEDGHEYFVWLREFENEAVRQQLYQETYNEWWNTQMRPKVFEHIDQHSVKVRLLEKVSV